MTREKPRYRNASGDPMMVNSTLYLAGAKFESVEWPKPGLEPLNESAERVAQYFETRRHSPFFPDHLRGVDGKPYLPAIFHQIDPYDFKLPGLPDDFDIPDDAPLYKLGAGYRIGRKGFAIGESATYLGWPSRWMEAANEAATAICAYYAFHEKHPDLPVCPWCLFHDAVHLPKLRELEERKAELPPMAGLPTFTPSAWPGTGVNKPPPSPLAGELKPPWRRTQGVVR